MYCTRKIKDDLIYIGSDDRRLAMFEGVYSVERGVSYNSYLLLDEKIVVFDTVDKAVGKVFFENLEHELAGKTPDYVIVQHMEPDHSATLTDLVCRYPDITIVCSAKSAVLMNQFFDLGDAKIQVVSEGEILDTGRHKLCFIMAPMVHWPEVMTTYDHTDRILFSADAFGTFGALNGALFADEVDFERDYLGEARRYYCNIVGKYGPSTQSLLNKMAEVPVEMLCPLHGFVWRENLEFYIEKYRRWSSYTPEENGVMIAYASIYGNTENAAQIISSRLRDRGVKTVMFDVSVTPASEIVAEAFRWSHLLFASSTYNMGVFVTMDELLRDLAAHNIQNRTVALVENGSWAPVSGKLMREILGSCKNLTFIENAITIKSSLKEAQLSELDALVDAIAASVARYPDKA
ncbi:MAG TPA: FprA family A-type flavoprotein [Oscillospiraceae bacterium]|nr:FprA family A-type flavoprotein [Oscillospiraceae bacterium]HPF56023.1 FprA family A-type flavoprotein [Clostridiales bacterium]HPK35513.1 FprA family A-type flavoprotein [Oscillospiraceae bacterium]HPR75648.1 FprA family A-type flavoprotein [Oscillospiraceae bacterium]